MTVKEANEKIIFFIENGEIQSDSLLSFVNRSIEETTTPRGVGPRDFVEKETFEIDRETFGSDEEFLNEINSESIYFADELRNVSIDDFEEINTNVFQLIYYVISSWGIRGNNYSSGKNHYSNVFLSEDCANDELFSRTYNYDFLTDDRRDTTYFETEDDAKDALIANIADDWGCSEYVVMHILRKQKLLREAREKMSFTEIEKRKNLVNELVMVYSKLIVPKKETYNETVLRLSDALSCKIDSAVFHNTVKFIRNNFNSTQNS